MGKIVTLGEVVADVYRERAPSDVELPFTARPGGAPANVAVAAAKLGAQAGFVGRLGDDLFGEFILRALDAVGVDISGVLRQPPPTRTTLAFVEVSADGDREFTFYRSVPAADELLAPDDISRESLEGASFANFGSIPLLKEPVRAATHRFAELANEMDVAVAFDVNLRAHLWDSLEAFREAVEPMLDLSTVVKLSEDELAPVLGTDDPDEGADMLLERGVSLALTSMGGDGALYATEKFRGHVSAFEIEDVVDATGAGDAFLAASLTHLSENAGWLDEEASVREAVRRGTVAGALACRAFGAMQALPTRDELERVMAART
ncbi:MAG TPA: carbohydrate kinase [Solirubrobacteraceae bacterium]|nr:carbohydrate kinase [Solirubrobacteraceae bacterium]